LSEKPAVGSLRFLARICSAIAAPSCRFESGLTVAAGLSSVRRSMSIVRLSSPGSLTSPKPTMKVGLSRSSVRSI
jgi:hypothetical protein